ncbi:hypothetical protein R9X47_19830 [Wukongibacter baidiensis]|uniref:hypothetical protein n=1 Tax=Wukongibacter baidiensis TaxID=1723361 RepID=UPI003D7F75E9
MEFLNNFFNIFRGKKDKRNNTASNNDLSNMQDTHVSFGEDPGSLENQENEKND